MAKKTTTNVAPKATDGAIMSYAKPYSELPASMKMSPIPASMQKSPIPAAKPQVKKESFFKKTFVTNPMETQKFINKSVKKFVTPPKRESE